MISTLERLAHVAELLEGLVARDGHAPEVALFPDDLEHRLLDLREVVLGEGALGLLEVVVEAVVDRGADGDLGAREEPLHRVGHDVGRRVADDREAARVLRGHELVRRGRVDRRVEVDDFAVDREGDDVLQEAFFGEELAPRLFRGHGAAIARFAADRLTRERAPMAHLRFYMHDAHVAGVAGQGFVIEREKSMLPVSSTSSAVSFFPWITM
jgi:hypothetical protein